VASVAFWVRWVIFGGDRPAGHAEKTEESSTENAQNKQEEEQILFFEFSCVPPAADAVTKIQPKQLQLATDSSYHTNSRHSYKP
jgi:hypothetical protein